MNDFFKEIILTGPDVPTVKLVPPSRDEGVELVRRLHNAIQPHINPFPDTDADYNMITLHMHAKEFLADHDASTKPTETEDIEEYLICPYCKHKHIGNRMLEPDEVVGNHVYPVACNKCDKEFLAAATPLYSTYPAEEEEPAR